MTSTDRHLKCVVLVIASHNEAFDGFKRIWEEHWEQSSDHLQNCLCFYLYNDESISEMKAEGNDLYFPYEETYPAPGLLLKTMDALEYLDSLSITYDFLIRTNLSSLFNWKACMQFIDNAPTNDLVAGVPYNTKRMSGMCMILSSDIVQQLQQRRSSLDFDLADDIAINRILNKMKNNTYIELKSIGIELVNGEVHQDISDSDVIHYRFHSGWVEGNLSREQDHIAMEKVHQGLLTAIVEHFCSSISNDPVQASIASMLILCTLVCVRNNRTF
jgi:hypothetical protein